MEQASGGGGYTRGEGWAQCCHHRLVRVFIITFIIFITGNYMYVFGGYEEIIERFGQDVYCLDLSSYSWKLVVSKPPTHDYSTDVVS